MENREAYQRAKKRAGMKFGFYIHLSIYATINILLILINLNTSGETLWFMWPLLGWGIGVFWHFIRVFVFLGRTVVPYKMIKKEMKKEASRK